jgi:hypothetical protein
MQTTVLNNCLTAKGIYYASAVRMMYGLRVSVFTRVNMTTW